MRPIIRLGVTDDARSILELWHGIDDVLPTTSDDEEALRVLLARDPESLLVAETNGQLVASLIVGWDGWRGNLYRLAVHPAQRRTGVAVALVAAAERRLGALSCRRIAAIVATSEAHAMRFWEAAGFQLDTAVGRFVKNVEPTR